MLDMRFIRENPDTVKQGLTKKYDKSDIDQIVKLDEDRREIIRQVEQLKSQRNTASAEIAKKKKAGEPADDAIAAMRKVGEEIAAFDGKLRELEQELQTKLSWVPNLPHDDVPVGKDETSNKFVRDWGEKPAQDFDVLPHWEIGEKLGIIDFQAAARLSGSMFYLLKGMGARLERALYNYMLDMHLADGYVECATPILVTADTMFGTGQLPKLADDMYKMDEDDLYLIPTAEVSLTNIYKGQIIDHTQLPIHLVGYTPCFRREAGAAGKDTRGMTRVHQFGKVELVHICRPENSLEEFDKLLGQAEKVLQGLKIPYRVMVLASGDLSFASARTYDLELYSAGVDKYIEISSVSTFDDFQARRMNARFRDEERKVQFVHTLNGSGQALARLYAAILENYQNSDGTITIPEVLRPYMGGADKIG
ncbi:MAG: serine--tRNA ligase [candidate division Zixibacteria bacterium]|nr:serine--tRNA ligase [candidate division Zixibacteria bacterium]MDH3938580.1 serine--tRNA ligase [candidate division Zixibacteria bacterium]MDH4033691.1 serine--tRNA ligase [candidate division Zixibacteria bacterium]